MYFLFLRVFVESLVKVSGRGLNFGDVFRLVMVSIHVYLAVDIHLVSPIQRSDRTETILNQTDSVC